MLHRQHHIAVICSDWEQAREFYVNKLGFELPLDLLETEDCAQALYKALGGN